MLAGGGKLLAMIKRAGPVTVAQKRAKHHILHSGVRLSHHSKTQHLGGAGPCKVAEGSHKLHSGVMRAMMHC